MVQKSTILTPIDKSGALSVNLFHIYGGRKKEAIVGDFIKVSVRDVLPNSRAKKKRKYVSIFIRSKFKYLKMDGSTIYSDGNFNVLLKKRLTPVGKEIHGPIYKNIKRKKFLASFAGVL